MTKDLHLADIGVTHTAQEFAEMAVSLEVGENMRAELFAVVLLVSVISVAFVRAGEAAPAVPTETSLRLSVDLIDGSRIVGAPKTNAVRFMSSLGEIRVPYARMTKMTFGGDHETIVLEMQNGDHMTGVVVPEPLSLAAVWGMVRIEMAHVRGVFILAEEKGMPATLRNGLISLWHFNGSPNDSKGNSNGTWLGAPAYATGLWGTQAGNFAGNGMTLNNPASLNVALGGAESFSVWFKHDNSSITADFELIFDLHNAARNTGRLNIGMLTEGSIQIFTRDGNNNPKCMHTKATGLNDNTWHHFAGVLDYNANTIAMYMDGRLSQGAYEGEAWNTGAIFDTGNIGSLAGANPATSSFKGLIEDLAVWNRALTADEVATLYHAGK